VSRRVSPETSAIVEKRDGGCVAALHLGATDLCRDRWGSAVSARDPRGWERDHVGEMRMGKAAPDDPAHIVLLCSWHHQGGWATSHRPELRAYLAR
jgi:hypothetical protein